MLAPVHQGNESSTHVWLLNPVTFDAFEISVSQWIYGTTWALDAGTLSIHWTTSSGSPHDPLRYSWRLDLATGVTMRLSARPVDESHQYPCGLHEVIVDLSDPIPFVRLEDPSTGEASDLVDPFAGRYPDSADPICSEATDLVGVLRWRRPEDGWPLFWYEVPATSLTVYTLDGRIYRAYENIFAQTWAPDDSHRMLHYTGSGFGAWDPCILDVDEGSDTCLLQIREWRESHGVSTGPFTWTPDAQSISFSYAALRGNRTGVCIYSISTQRINCPITELLLPPGFFVWDHAWSPHGDYLTFTIDTLEPADLHLNPRTVTSAADGSNLHVWDLYSLGPDWRPDL